MVRIILSLFMVSLVLKMVTCQTFQYSRGWTNGKRSDDALLPLPDLKFLDSAQSSFDLHTAETLSGLCCEMSCPFKKVVKMLRINGKPKFYLVPCELLRNHHTSEESKKLLQDILPADGHYRRSLSNEYDSNSDNY